MDSYTAQACGTTGHEILGPNGDVVAWTVDGYWGTLIAALLNESEQHGLVHPRPVTPGGAKSCGTSKTVEEVGDPPEPVDHEQLARAAVVHLAYNGLNVSWELPGDPSEAIREMVEKYFRDGEIVETLGDLAVEYVMKSLADDHLGFCGIDIPEESDEHATARPPEGETGAEASGQGENRAIDRR